MNGAELKQHVTQILRTQWTRRDGRTIPTTETVGLGNDAVEIDGAVLYADLVDSTALVAGFKDWFAAEVYKCFLDLGSRIIRQNGGEVCAFDGDRVMGVFLGEAKESAAAKAGLQLNWAVRDVINPAIPAVYPNTTYKVKHVVGIDSSKLFVARTGIRGSNDLVWVGRAANQAAKLCALREGGYATVISETVYDSLKQASKFGGDPKQNMWLAGTWAETGERIYRSNWTWALG